MKDINLDRLCKLLSDDKTINPAFREAVADALMQVGKEEKEEREACYENCKDW